MQLLQSSDFAPLLTGSDPYTIFVPTNGAFQDIDLNLISNNTLAYLLSYHIAPGFVPTGDFFPSFIVKNSIYTLQGSSLVADIDMYQDRQVPTVNQAMITNSDLQCVNGVVHFIDSVLIPPSTLSIGQNLQVDSDFTRLGMAA